MIIESYTETNVGKKRKNNEDNFFVNGIYKNDTEQLNEKAADNSFDIGLYAVCDGMGGEAFGEKASLIAVSALTKFIKNDFNIYASEYIEDANKLICDLILQNNGQRSGTTFAALYIKHNKASIYNIGDSRVYMLRDKKLTQLSIDDTKIRQMLAMGIISPETAKTYKDRHIITQHLGIFPDEMIISEHRMENIEIKPNDMFLLCSDGLTDMLDDSEIEELVNKNKSCKDIATLLIQAALEHGGNDNVTVQIVKCKNKRKSNNLKITIVSISAILICIALLLYIETDTFFNKNSKSDNKTQITEMESTDDEPLQSELKE